MDLNKFNVLIGACGSGKTNFVEVFELLRDISNDFHDAIRKHGGSYLRNFSDSADSCLKVRFVKNDTDRNTFLNVNDYNFDFNQVDYEICFSFNGEFCRVKRESVRLNCCVLNNTQNTIIIENNDGDITSRFLNPIDLDISSIISDNIMEVVSQKFKNANTPLINSILSTVPIDWADLFKGIVCYDFDPKYCKNVNALNEGAGLTKYGGNLPGVLREILNDPQKKKDFLLFYTNFIPYIKDVGVERILNEERIFIIKEAYSDVKIPSPFLSDGTSTIMAMLIAFYFQDGEIILIEEPERHVHPSLINKLMLMMESVRNKQVIITTHSPELLKYPELDDIYYISRDDDGFSQITRIIDNEMIELLGIESAFASNYLENSIHSC